MVGRWVLVPKIGVRIPIPQVCTIDENGCMMEM